MSDSSPTRRWAFLVVVSAALFLIGVDNSVLYTALPVLRQQLGTTELEALWIINAYPLVLAALLLGTGTLGDKIGHRLMFLIGLTVFTAASLAAAFSPTAWTLVGARALLGLGAATMMPATLALIRLTFDDARELSTAIGIWASMATLGAAVGPLVGGFLLEHYWWGSIFLINVPVAVAAFIGTIAIAPANMADPSRHWDFPSSLYAMFAMAGFVMVVKELAGARTWPVLAVAAALAVGGGAAFTRRQRILEHPLLDFGIFRNRVFLGGFLAAGLGMFVLAGTELTSAQRFQLAAGFSPLEAGGLAAAAALAAFPFAVLGGANLHRVGFRTLVSGGFAVTTVGVLGIIAGVSGWGGESLAVIIAGFLLLGAGTGLTMSVASTAIIGSAPVRKAGMASAVEEVSYEFGTLLSVAIMGSLLPLFYAGFAGGAGEGLSGTFAADLADPLLHDAAAPAFDSSYLTILGILAATGALAAAVTAVLFRGNPKEAVPDEAE